MNFGELSDSARVRIVRIWVAVGVVAVTALAVMAYVAFRPFVQPSTPVVSQPSGPVTTPAPSPTCPPDPTHARAWPCTPAQQARAAQITKAHTDAYTAIKAGLAEYYRMANKWETKTTPRLKKYMTPTYEKLSLEDLQYLRNGDLRLYNAPKPVQVRYDTAAPTSTEGATQQITVCWDRRGMYGIEAHKRISINPLLLTSSYELHFLQGQWKIHHGFGDKPAKSCNAI